MHGLWLLYHLSAHDAPERGLRPLIGGGPIAAQRHPKRRPEEPKVNCCGGLSLAIAFEQKAVCEYPRPTAGTITELPAAIQDSPGGRVAWMR